MKASRRGSLLAEVEEVVEFWILEQEFQPVLLQWGSLGTSLGEGWKIRSRNGEGFPKIFWTDPAQCWNPHFIHSHSTSKMYWVSTGCPGVSLLGNTVDKRSTGS